MNRLDSSVPPISDLAPELHAHETVAWLPLLQREVVMEPLTAVVAVVALFVVLALIVARVDGLTFLAPASTRAIRSSAEVFCTDECRANGRCPLTGTEERADACPLWKYVGADVPTVVRGSPFEALHA
jgi:hypothetical protein